MDRYYQLLDRDPSTISPIWKGGHIICFALAVVSGFIAAYALGKTEEYFGNNCVLFASIAFQNQTFNGTAQDNAALRHIPSNTVPPFNMSHTQWGSVKLCNFCQFTPLCTTIFSIVWGTLFIICSRGGAGYMMDEVYRPWRLVYPAMIFILITTAVMLASLLQVAAGVKHFCAQFEPIFNTTSCVSEIDVYTMSFSTLQKPLVTALKVGLAFTYICFFAGLIHLCLIVLRVICIVDFQMIRITVTHAKLDNTKVEDNTPPPSVAELPIARSMYDHMFMVPSIKGLKDNSSTSTTVPIAQSESLSDVLSPSPKTPKSKDHVIFMTVTPTNIDLKQEENYNILDNVVPIKETEEDDLANY